MQQAGVFYGSIEPLVYATHCGTALSADVRCVSDSAATGLARQAGKNSQIRNLRSIRLGLRRVNRPIPVLRLPVVPAHSYQRR